MGYSPYSFTVNGVDGLLRLSSLLSVGTLCVHGAAFKTFQPLQSRLLRA